MQAIRQRWTALLACAVAAAAIATLVVMRSTGLRGDEFTYIGTARGLAGHLGFGAAPGESFSATLLGTGWFMQGLGLLGTALFVPGEPALWQIRLFALVMNLTLLALLALAFARTFGRTHPAALLVFPGLAAGWHVAASAFLPDVAAGLLGTMALVAAYRAASNLLQGQCPGWRDIAVMETALLLAIYARGPALALAAALHGLLIVLALLSAGRKVPALARIWLGLALLAALVAPWSITASRHFGEPVLTTTNVPLVLADSFGDPDMTCFGPCGEGYDIVPAWEYAQREAPRQGINPLELQRRMMANSLSGLTVRGYLAQVREHFGRFLFDPLQRVRNYQPVMYGVPEALRGTMVGAITVLTLLVYVPFLVALGLANVLVFRSGPSARLQGVLLKLGTAALFIQPFVHKSSARYWATFAPLMAWSAALLLTTWRERNVNGPAIPPGGVLAARWIDYAQVAWSMGICCIAAAIVLA